MRISQEGIEITNRFFEAIQYLRNEKIIRGLGTFTREFDINRWNMVTVRDNPHRAILKPEWIYYLHKSYNVSVRWIITGQGKIIE